MKVWDVGCGYGVLGLSAALAGADKIWFSDINTIALDYTKKNVHLNHLDSDIRVFPADCLNNQFEKLPSKTIFDLVVSNPAFHQGRDIDRSMAYNIITQASNILATDGALIIVANRFLNYDRLMKGYFRFVTRLTETSQYHIIQAKN